MVVVALSHWWLTAWCWRKGIRILCRQNNAAKNKEGSEGNSAKTEHVAQERNGDGEELFGLVVVRLDEGSL